MMQVAGCWCLCLGKGNWCARLSATGCRDRSLRLWRARGETPTVGLIVDLGGEAVLKIVDGSQVALAAKLIQPLRVRPAPPTLA